MNKSIWDMLFIKNIFIILGLFWGSRNVYLLMKNGMKGFTLIEIPGIVSFCVAIFLIAGLLKCFSIKTGQKYLKSSAITFLIYWSMILLTILLEGSIHILVLGVYSLGVWLAAIFMSTKRASHSFGILEKQCPNIVFKYREIKDYKRKLKFLESELNTLATNGCSETVMSAIEERVSAVYVSALHFETVVITTIILVSIPQVIR